MVQIIEENRRPSTAEQFNRAFGRMAQTAGQFGQAIPEARRQRAQKTAFEEQFPEAAGMSPEMQQMYAQYAMQGKNQQELQAAKMRQDQAQSQQQAQLEERDYNFIKESYGDRAADLYRAAPQGGKTEVIKTIIESSQRGQNVESALGMIPKGEAFEDFDKGLTPKERVKRQEDRYAKNLPLYEESQTKLRSYNAIGDELGILVELSPQISGWERLNINPLTGELIIPAAASPEAQRFVKTINDFTTQAKDSYGSRVTNFDLNQFMKRLPTLANSAEGRHQILEQMQIINDINKTHEKALSEVFDEYGGVRMIDYDKAQGIAEKRAKNEIKSLKGRFASIGRQVDKMENQRITERKKDVPKGRVAVRNSQGIEGYIPSENLKEFLKTPGNEVL